MKQDNRLFQIHEKQFYNQLQQDIKVKGNSYPTKEEIEEFWKNLWADRQQYNESGDRIQKQIERVAVVPVMDVLNITIEDVRTATKRTNNWNAAGADHIQNYWYKQFSAAHDTLKRNFNDIIQDPNKIPEFMTKGKTILIPKDENNEDHSTLRPITCLPTVYKIFTSVITQKTYRHIETHNIISEEQKGCLKNSRGCKEQTVIDEVILNQVRRNNITSV
jgi:hypothetical protein